MAFHERLKDIRSKSGLTQAEFAAAVGVSTNTQMRYEKGQRRPDTDYLQCVANKFNVTLNWLIGGDKAGPDAIREADQVTEAMASMFGITEPNKLLLLFQVLQLQGNSERLSTLEQNILTAFRSTDFDGQVAIDAVCKVVKKRKLEPNEAVVSHTWGVNEIIESLQKAVVKIMD